MDAEFSEDIRAIDAVPTILDVVCQTTGKLFQPFSRGEVRSILQGLGLGLYISSQIAAAYDGSLSARSKDRETVFTFRIPMTKQAEPT